MGVDHNPCMPTLDRHAFWLRTKLLTLGLLLAWLLVNLLTPWFARDLMHVTVLGFPLGFWLAAEGALLVYLALTMVYVFAMDRLEDQLEDQQAERTPEAQPVESEIASKAGLR